MNTIGYYIGISKQTEVLLLVLAGICCTIFDASLFNLHTNLYKVWNMPMDPTKFTNTAQLYVKYILSSIVLVRTFTVHLYLAFYIVMLWPAIFEEKAGLLIPWLVVGAVKCLAMGAMSFSTGLYICLTYRFSKAACWDFLMTQVIDQGPSIYMWFCVLSYYYDIKRTPEPIYRCERSTPSIVFSLAERRRRVRSLFADSKLQNTVDDDRQLISVSTIDNIINQLNINLRRDTSRSLDSMLSRLAAEAEKDEILDIKDDTLDENKDFSVAERALKVLNISPSYVSEAKIRKADNKLIKSTGHNLKVQSSPVMQAHRAETRKSKKLSVKIAPMESDELSLILSEAEVGAIGYDPEKVWEKENFDVQKIFEKQNDIQVLEVNDTADKIDNSKVLEVEEPKAKDLMVEDLERQESNDIYLEAKDLEVEELHINSFRDNISDTSKVECIVSENDSYLNTQDIKNVKDMTYRSSSTKENTKVLSATLKASSAEKTVTLQQSIIVKEPSKVLEKPEVTLKEPSSVLKHPSVARGKLDVTSKEPSIIVREPSVTSEKTGVALIEPLIILKESSATFRKSDFTLKEPSVVIKPLKPLGHFDVTLKELSVIAKEPSVTSNKLADRLKDPSTDFILKKSLDKLKEPITTLKEPPVTINVSSAPLKEHPRMLEKSSNTVKEPSVILKESSKACAVQSVTSKEPPVILKGEQHFLRTPITKQTSSNYKKTENISKVNQQVSTPIEVNVPKSLPKTIKFKPITNAHFYSLPPPSTFKHDGYTLAYIESQQRKAATDIIKNKKRPSSSGV